MPAESPAATQIPAENIADWKGKDVLDPDGEKLGKLEELYYDGETDMPSFVAVKTGLLGKKLTLVPLRGSSVGTDYVRVAWSKHDVKDAPDFGTDQELSADEE